MIYKFIKRVLAWPSNEVKLRIAKSNLIDSTAANKRLCKELIEAERRIAELMRQTGQTRIVCSVLQEKAK